LIEKLHLIEQLPQEEELHALDELYPDYYDLFSGVSDKVALETIQLMCGLDKKHKGTSLHSLNVSVVSFRLAKDLSTWLNIGDPYLVARAGLLHDIGKFYIDRELLDADGDEHKIWKIYHPDLGKDVVEKFDFICAEIIQKHHTFQKKSYPEQSIWDGDNELLVSSALISVADQVISPQEGRGYISRRSTAVEAVKSARGNLIVIPEILRDILTGYANEVYTEVQCKIKNPRFSRTFTALPLASSV